MDAGHSTTTPERCNNLPLMEYEHWRVTTATIESCDWQAPPPSQIPSSLFLAHFTVAFRYAADGNQYRGNFCSAHEWEKGTEVGILYNPQNPAEICVCGDDESRVPWALECALELLGGLTIEG